MRPWEAVGLPGLTRASAYRVGIQIMSLSPVGAQAHCSELLRVVGLCSRACDRLALWLRRRRRLRALRHAAGASARRLCGAASGDWRATGVVCCAGCALEGLWAAGEDGGAPGDCGAACMRTTRLY